MRVTRKNICKAIKDKTGYGVKLARANDYFYFYDNSVLDSLYSTSVYSNLLTHQSVDDWVRDFEDMIK